MKLRILGSKETLFETRWFIHNGTRFRRYYLKAFVIEMDQTEILKVAWIDCSGSVYQQISEKFYDARSDRLLRFEKGAKDIIIRRDGEFLTTKYEISTAPGKSYGDMFNLIRQCQEDLLITDLPVGI